MGRIHAHNKPTTCEREKTMRGQGAVAAKTHVRKRRKTRSQRPPTQTVCTSSQTPENTRRRTKGMNPKARGGKGVTRGNERECPHSTHPPRDNISYHGRNSPENETEKKKARKKATKTKNGKKTEARDKDNTTEGTSRTGTYRNVGGRCARPTNRQAGQDHTHEPKRTCQVL